MQCPLALAALLLYLVASSECYVIVSEQKQMLCGQKFSLHTSKGTQFTSIDDRSFSIKGKEAMTFRYRGKNNMHVLLQNGKDDFDKDVIDIAVGEKSITFSSIWRPKYWLGGAIDKLVPDLQIADPNQFRSFWISWKNGIIRCGLGHEIGKDEFMSYSNTAFKGANYFSVSSGSDSDGDWEFGGTDCAQKCKSVECPGWSFLPALLFNQQECKVTDASEIISISVAKQYLLSNCIKDKNYGLRGESIWVNRECSAQFKVCYQTGDDTNERQCGIYTNGCHELASCQRKGETEYCACKAGYYGNGVDSCGGACTCTGSGDPHYKTFDGSMIHFQGICKYVLSELRIGSPCDYRVLVQNEHRHGNTRVSFTKRVDVEIRNTTISLRKDRMLFVNKERKYTPFEADDLTYSIFMRGSGEIVVQTSCKVIVIYDGYERVSVTVPVVYGRNITGLCGNCNGEKSDDFLTKERLDVSKEQDRYARIGNSFAVPDPETPPEICAMEDVKITCSPEFKGLAASNDYCGLLRNITGPFAEFIKKEPAISEKIWEACLYDVCSFEDNLAEATKTACKALENFAKTIQENGQGKIIWRTAARCPLTCGENMEYSLNVGVLPTCTSGVQSEQYDVTPVDGCTCKPGFVQSGDKCVRKEECGCKTKVGNQYLPVGETFVTEDCRFMNQCQYRNGKSEIVTLEIRPACHLLAQCKPDETTGQYKCQCQKGTVGDGITSCIAACGNAKKPCHPNAICTKGMEKQVNQCRCKDGYFGDGFEKCTKSCECVASGDPHYTTFDGQKIHFQGLCKYTLASIPYCSINVEVKNQPVPGNKVSTTKLVEVKLPSTKIRIGQKKNLLINGEIAYAPIEGIGYRIYEKGSMVVETDCGVVVMFDGANTARVLVPSQYGNSVTGICGNCDGIQNDFRTKTGQFVSGEANKYSLIGDSYVVPDETEQGSESCQTENVDPTCPQEWDSKKKSNEYCGLILDPKGPFGQCLAKYPEIGKSDGIISDCTYDVCANSADPKNAQEAACTALAMLAYWCQQKSDIDIIAWRKADFCPLKECGENMVYNPAIMQCPATCQDPMRRTPCHAGLSEGCECKPGFFRSGAACVPREQCGCAVQNKYYPLNTTVTSSDCRKRYICVHKDGSSYMEKLEDSPSCGAKASCRLNNEGNYQCQCDKNYKGDGFTCENVCGIQSKVCHKYASCLSKGNIQYCSCKAGYYGNGVDSCGGACTCTGSGDPHYKTFDGSMIHFQGICKYLLSELSVGSECDYRVLVQNENRQGNTRVSFTKRVDIEIGNTIISLRKDRLLFVNGERKYPPLEANDLSFSIFMRGSGEIVVQTSCKVIVIFDGNQRVSVTVPDFYGRNLTGLCGNCNGETGDDFLTKDKLDVSKEQDRYARIGNSFVVPDKETPPEICPTENVKIKCSPEFLAVANSAYYCGLLSGTTGPFADFIKKEPETAAKYFEACLFDVCSYEGNLTEAKRTACDTLDSYAKALQEKGLGRVIWRSSERCPLTCGENMEYSTNVGAVPTCSDINGVPAQQFDVPTVDGCVCKQGFLLSGDRCVRKEECGCKVDNQYLPLGEKFATEDCRLLKQCQYKNGKSEIVTLETRPACHLLAQCKPDETTGQYKCQCQKGTVGDGITSCIAACGYANKPCHSNAICSKGTGKQLDQCRCKEGYYGDGIEKCTKSCECVASGDPHYTTFDGQKIHFQGLCKYTLASIPYCSINVEVKNQPVPGNKVSTTKLVEVKLPSTKIRIGQKKHLLINGEIAYAPIEGIGYRIYEKGSMVVETDCGVVVMFDGANTARVLVPSQYGNNVTGICGNCDGIQNDFRTKTGQFVSGEANKYSLVGDSYVVPDETEQGSESCQTESVDPTCPQEWDSKKKSNEYCGLILDPKGPFGQCLAKYPEIGKSDGIISDCTYDVCANSADPKNAQEAACTALAMLAYWCQQKSDIDIIAWRKADFCPLKECGENMVYNPAIMQCPATCQDPMRRTPCHAGLSEGCECKPGFFRSGAACVPRDQCGCAVQNKYYPLNTTVTSSDCRKRYICVHKDGSSYMEKLEDSPSCGAKASCRLNNEGNYQCQCDKNYKGDGFTCENVCGIQSKVCHKYASCLSKGNIQYCSCKAGYYGNGVDSCGGACTCTGSGDPHYKTFDGSMIHFQGICKYLLSELSVGSECDYRVLVQNENRQGNTRVSFTKRVDIEIGNTIISLRKDRLLFVNGERKYPPLEANDLSFSIFMRGSGEIVVQTSCKVIVIFDGNQRVSVTVPDFYGRNLTGLCGNCNGDTGDDFLTMDKLDVSKEQDRYARIGNSFAVPDKETPPEICPTENVKIKCSPEFLAVANSAYYCGLLSGTTGPFADFIKKEPETAAKYFEACLFDVCAYEGNLTEAKRTACDTLDSYAKALQEKGLGRVIWRSSERCPLTCGENMEYSTNVGAVPTCSDINGVPAQQFDVPTVDGCVCKQGFLLSGDRCVRKEECGCKVDNQYLPLGEKFATEDCRLLKQCQYKNGKSEIVTLETRPACHLLAQCKPDETTGQYKCQCQKGTVGDGITSCIAACGYANKPCHSNAICSKGTGKQLDQCRCKEGYYGDGIEKCTKSCECVASGDPHYTTFDGQKIHFQGLCKYTLASIPYCSINVEVKNQPVPGNKVSTTKLVEVKLPSTKIRIGQKKHLLINGEIAYAPIEGIGYRIYEKGSMVVETDCGVVVMFDGANTARVLVPSQYGNNVTGICGNCDGIQNDFRTKTGQFVSGEANKYSLVGDSYVVPDETEQGSESCQTESVDPTCPQEWDSKKKSNEYCGLILDPKGPFGQCLAKYPEIGKSDGIISDCTYDVCANSADPKNAQEAACTALAMLAYWCQQKSDIDIIAWRKADFCPLKECGENMVYNPAIMQCPATCQDPMRRTPCHAGLSEGCECKPGFFRSGAACVPRDQCGCAVQNKYYPLNTAVTSSDCRKRYICVHKDGSSYMEKLEDSPPCGAKASCRLNNEGNYQCQCDKNYKGDGFTCENVCGIQSKVCHKYASCLSKGNIQYCSCKAGYYGNGVDSCGGACTCTGSGDPHYKTFDGSMIHFQGICKYLSSELSVGSECDYRVLVQNENRQGNTRVSFTKRVDIEIGNTIISLRKDRLLFVNGERKYPPLEANDLSFSIFMRGSGEIVVQTSCKVIVIFDGNQRVSVTVPDFYGRNLTGLCGNCNGDTGDDFLTKDKLDVSKEQDRYARIGNSFVVPDKETPPEICPTEEVKIKCSPEFLAVANSTYYCGLLSGTTGPFADFIKKEPETAAKYFGACLFDVCSYEGNLTEAKRTACDTLDSYAKALQEKGLGRVIWRSSERCPLTCGENMEYSTNVGAVPTCSDINGVPAQQFDVPTVDGCVCKHGFLLSGDRCVRKEECGCKVDNQYLPVGEKFATGDCRLLKQCQYKNGKSEIVTLETRPACHLLAQCKPDETTGQYKCQCQKGTVGDGITSCIAACGYASKPCHSNAICSKGTGKQLDQCRCKEGYFGDGIEKCTKSCECVASGDPHYTTFDGQKIHFQGLCKYTLASIPYCSINVEVKNQPVPGNKVSTTKLVEVKLPSTKIRIGQKKHLLINGEIAYAPIEGIGYRIYEKGSMVVETDCGVVVMFDGANTARVLVPSQYGNNVTGICGNCDGIQNDFRTKTGQFVSGEANKYSLIGDSYVVPDETEQGSESCQTENVDPTCPQEWDSKKRSNEYCGLILDPKGPFGQCLAKYPEIAKSDGIISDCTYDVCANSADAKNAQEAACTALAMLAYWCQQKSDIDIIAWRKADFCPLKECGENMDYNPAIMQCPTTCQDPMRRTLCHAGLSEGCECKPGFFRSGAACVPREQCGCTVQSKYYPLNTTVTSSDCRKRYICVHKDGSSYMERLEDSPSCGAKASCRLNNEGNYQCQCDKNYKGDGFTCENVCGIQSKVCHKYASCLSKGNIQYCSCKAGYYGNGVDSCGGACTCTGSGDPHYKTFDGSMIHFQGICKYLFSELSVGSECDYRVLVQNENRQGNTRVSFTKRVDIEIGNTIISLRKDRLLFVNGERKYPPLEANDLSFSIFMRGSGEIVVQTSCKVIVIFDGNQRVSVTVPDFYGRNLTGLCGNCNGDTGDDFLTKDKLDVSKEQDRYARIGNSFVVPDKETPPEICPTEEVKIKCSPEFLAVANSTYYCGLLSGTTGPFADFIKKEPETAAKYFGACLFDVCSYEGNLTEAKRTACDTLDSYAKALQEKGLGRVIWRSSERCPLTCGENMEYSTNVGAVPTCSDINGVPAQQFYVPTVDGCVCKHGFLLSGDRCVRKEECGCKVDNQYLPVGEKFATGDCRLLKQCQYKNGKKEIVTLETRPACHLLAQCKPDETTGQYKCQCQKGTVGDGITSCIAACGYANKPCHSNAICSKGTGKQLDQCRCKEGYYGDGIEKCTKSCECVASGDPHYTTFDGQKIHFQGLCKYTLASIPYCSINVEVKNQPVPGNKVSTTKLVEVKLPSTKIRIGQKKHLLINGEIAYAPIEGIGYRIYEKGSMVVETDCGVVVMFDGANTARVLVPSQYGKNVTGICGNCDGIQNDFRTKTGQFVSGEANKYSLIGDSYVVPDETEQGSESCQTESVDPTCPQEWDSKKRSNEYCGLILDPKGPFGQCLAKYPEIAKEDGIISDCTYDVCANSADPKNAQEAACTALAMLAYWCQQKSDIDIIAWRKADFCPLKECGENMDYNPAIMQCPTTCQDPMRRTPCHAGLSEGCECKPGFFRSGAACVPREQCGCAVQSKYYPLNTTVTSSDCRKRYICVHKDGSSYMERLGDSPPCGAKASCRLNNEGNYQCQCDKNYKGDGFTCENVCGIQSNVCHKYASCLSKGNIQYCSCKAGYYGNGVDSCGGACTCTGSGDPHYKTFDGSMIHFQGICKYLLSELSVGSECDYRVLVQNENRQGNTRVSFTKRVDIEIGNTIISLRKDRLLFVNGERKYPPMEANDLSFSIFMRGSGEIVVQTSCKVIVIFDGNQRVSVTVPDFYGRNLTGLCGNCNGDTGDDFLTMDKLDVSKEQDRYARIGNSFAVPDKETPPEICPTEDVKIKCSPEFLAVANSTYYCGLLSGTTGPFADFIKKEPEIAAKYFEACLFDVCSYEGNLTEAKRTACDTLDSYAKALQQKGLGRVIWRSSERCPLRCGENMEYSTNVGAVPTCSDMNGVTAQQFDVPTVDGCVCKQGFLLSSDRCVRKEECGCKVDNQYLPLGEKFATGDCRLLKQCQYKNGKKEIVTLETRPACHLLAQCKPDETTGQYKCQCQKGTVGDGITSCIAACGYANKPCHSNATCSKGTGKQLDQCRCKEGYFGDGIEKCTKSCECVASGDPHYTTFDGQKIHFQGLCKYTLASIPYCSINVEVKNQPVPGNKVSTTKLVEVKLPSTKIRIGQKKHLLINGEIAYAPIEGIGYRIYEKGSMVVETDCGVVVMFDGANTARVLVPSQYGKNVTGICGNCDGIQNDFRTKTGQFVAGEANKYSLIGDSYVVPDETEQGSESCQTESVDPTCPQEWDSKKRSNEYCGLILDPKGPFGQCLAKYPEIAKEDGIISDCTYDVCANSADPKNAQEAACTALAMLAYWCQQKSDIDIIAWRKADFCPLKECGENMDYNPAIMQCPTTCQDPMRRTPCHAGLSEGCECKPGFFRSGAACVPREQCGCAVQNKYYPLNTTVTSSDCRKRYICVHKDGSSYMERLGDSPPCGAKASCRLNNEGNYQCQCDKNYKGDGFTCENVCGIQSKVCHKYASCLSKGNIQYCSCKAGYYGNGVDSCGGACTCTGSGDPHYKTFDGSMIHFQGICKYLLSELSVGSQCDYRVLVQNENRQGNTRVSFTKRVDIEIGNTIISLRKDRLLFVNGERKYPPMEANDLSFSIFMRGSGEIVVQTSCKVIVIFDGNQRVSVTVPDFYGRNLTGLCGNCNGDTGDDFLTMDKLDVSKEQDRYARIGNSFAVPDKETPPEICPTEDVKIKCSPEFLAVANSTYYCGLLSGTTGPFADFIKKEPEIAAKYFEACLFDVCSYEGNLTEAKRTACDTLDSYAKALQQKGLGRVIWRSSERCPLRCGENMEYSTNVGAVPTCSDMNGVTAQQFDVPTVDGCVCKQGFLLSSDRCVRKEECGCKVDNQYLPLGEKFATGDCRLLKQCQYKNGKKEIVTLETRPACHLLAQCKPDETTGQYKCQCQKGTVGDGITSCIAACGYANKPCHSNAICSKGTGKQLDQCRCKEGYFGDGIEKCTKSCECVASGDPHYTTFDGQKIHFQGLCKYTLASIPYCSINVEVKNQPVPGNKVSTTKLVEVKLPSTKIRIGQKKHLLINGEIAYAPIEGIGYRIYEKGSMVVETDCGVVVMFDGANTARVLVPSQYGKNVTGICGNCDGIQNDFRTKTGQFVAGEANKYSLIGDSYVVPDETEQGSESCQTESVDPTCPQEWDSKKRSNEYCGLILDPKGPFGQCLAKYPEIAKEDGIISDCTYDVCANSADAKNAQEAACTALAMLAYWCQQKSDIDIIAWRKADFCPLKECGENMDYNPAIMQCPTTCQDPMRRTPCHAGLSEGCECKPGFFRSGAACVPREQCGCAVQNKYYPLNTTVTSSDCRKRYICVHKDGSSYMERLGDSPPCGAKASCRLNNEGNYQCQCDKNYKGDGFTCENVCGIQSKVCHKYASCLSKGNIQYCSCKAGYYGNGVDSCGGACTCTGSGDPHYKTFDGSMIHFQGICKYLLSELSVGSQCDYRVLVQNENRQGNTRVSFTKRVDIEIGNTIISLRKDRLLFVNGERKYPPMEANDLSFSIFMRGSGEIVVQTSCKVIVIFDGNQRVSVTVPDFYGRNLTGLCGNCNGDTGDDFLTMDKLDVSKEQDRYARIGNSFAVPDKETPPEICPTEDVKIKCSPEFLAVANSTYYCGLLSGTTGPFADFIKKEPEIAAKYFEACLFDVCSYEGNLTEAKRTACDTLDSYAKALQQKGLGRVIWRSSERCPLRCGENMEYSTNVGAVPTCSDMNGVTAQQFDVPTVDGCVCKQGFLLSSDRCVRKEECGCKVDNQYLPLGEKFATGDCRLLKQCQYKNGKKEIVTLETRPACHLLAQCKPDETTGQYKCQCQKGTVGDGITSCIAACGYANKPCHSNAICSKGTGKQLDQCRCKEGYFGDGIEKCTKSCECVASGDPHYTTFDGQKIHFQGLCKYTLASIPYCSINVEVKNQPVPGNKVSTTKLVEVKLPSTKIRIGQKKHLLINGEIAYAPIEGIGYRIYEKGSMVVETDCGVVVMFDGANTARVLVPSQYGKNVTGICGNCDGIQNDFRTKTGQFVAGEANKYSLIGDSYVVPDETEQGSESCQTESVDPTCPQEWDSKKRSNEYCGLILDPKGPFGQCLAKYPEIAKEDGIISDCTYDVCANSADPKNAQEAACTALAMLAYWCQQKSDIDIIAWRKADFCPLKECGENMDYNPAIMQCPTTCQDPMRRTPCHAGLSEGCECKPGFFRSGAACVPREQCGCAVQNKYYPLNTTVIASDCRKRYICVHKDGSSYMERLQDSPPCGAKASCRLNNEGNYQCQCDKNYKGDGFTCENLPPSNENSTCSVTETTTGCNTVKIIKGNCYYTSNFKGQCRYVVNMIHANAAIVYIGDSKAIRLDSYNNKEYVDCAAFKMEFRQVTVKEPTCGCE